VNELHLLHLIIGVDLLDRLLLFDHRIRPTAAEALGDLLQQILEFILSIWKLYFSSSIF
jgi:hypothetical protein